jgi:hypothetical protein
MNGSFESNPPGKEKDPEASNELGIIVRTGDLQDVLLIKVVSTRMVS